ncbi:MAG: NCS2 family permease [Bacteroidales bacterium]|nr:NCS2 family permease [Bacteroidales bacterium]
MSNFLNKAFGFEADKHNVRTEIIAGITTFLTMAYILAVNPSIFSALDGMPGGAVFTATALAAIVGTLVMALYAKKPFALAPGMGLNAFFVYTVCLTMGYSWQFALTAVLLEGILFIIMTVTKVRTLLLNSIPGTLKKAIGAGIGLFIAFIGFQNAGIIVHSDSTLVTLGNITEGTALVAFLGLMITSALVMLKVRGGILIGIIVTTLIGLVVKDPATGSAVTQLSRNEAGALQFLSLPDSVSPIFCKFEFSQILSWDMLVVVFTFLFVDMFDTMGTIIGVHQGAGLIPDDGPRDNVPGAEKMFLADSIATVAGACLGTSTTTTYVESAAGVGEGGRTGLTAFSTAICFALALFFSPIFLSIPSAATAPALIMVGVMMMPSIKRIHWEDYCKSIPAFITIIMMPVAYSISDGILIGVISYVITHAIAGRVKEISVPMWVLSVLFVLRYIFI